ncbi:MAG: hypothetical protein ACLPWS_21665 [Rhodomicrobium sp.]
MPSSMAFLDCRLGYYGLLSVASSSTAAKMEENAEWISVNVADGHFLFSKPPLPGHPMAVRRKMQAVDEHFDILTEGCAFGDKEGYKVAMAKLPPALKIIHTEANRTSVQLKAVLSQ